MELQIAQVEAELDQQQELRSEYMREVVLARETEKQSWRDEVTKTTDLIAVLQQRIETLRYTSLATEQESAETSDQLARIKDMGLPAFWQQQPHEINQQLHRALGGKRIVVRDGEIEGNIRVIRKR